MTQFISTLVGIFQSSGFARFGEPGGYLYAIMICVGCFLLYLAIVKEFEPLILLPMAFGMILANLPGSGIIHMQYFVGDGLEHPMWIEILNNGGLADMLYMGVEPGTQGQRGGLARPRELRGAGHGHEPERARPAGDRLYGRDPPHRPPLSEKTYFTVWKKLRYFLFLVVESGRKILYNIFKSVFAGGAMRFGRRRIND